VDVDDSRPFRSPEYYQILTQILKEMGWEAETDGTSMTRLRCRECVEKNLVSLTLRCFCGRFRRIVAPEDELEDEIRKSGWERNPYPVNDLCPEHAVPPVDRIPEKLKLIEIRWYHGYKNFGTRAYLHFEGRRRPKRVDLSEAAAIMKRWAMEEELVWADGAWAYGKGYTFMTLKPKRDAKYRGMNLLASV